MTTDDKAAWVVLTMMFDDLSVTPVTASSPKLPAASV